MGKASVSGHPEVSRKETWTAERIEAELDALGITEHKRVDGSGVYAVLPPKSALCSAKSLAPPRRQAMCPSWPQACIAPNC